MLGIFTLSVILQSFVFVISATNDGSASDDREFDYKFYPADDGDQAIATKSRSYASSEAKQCIICLSTPQSSIIEEEELDSLALSPSLDSKNSKEELASLSCGGSLSSFPFPIPKKPEKLMKCKQKCNSFYHKECWEDAISAYKQEILERKVKKLLTLRRGNIRREEETTFFKCPNCRQNQFRVDIEDEEVIEMAWTMKEENRRRRRRERRMGRERIEPRDAYESQNDGDAPRANLRYHANTNRYPRCLAPAAFLFVLTVIVVPVILQIVNLGVHVNCR